MPKNKFLFILIIEVFAFIASLTLFMLLISGDGYSSIEDKLMLYFIGLLILATIVYKIASKLYKNIEYHNINKISFDNDKEYFRDIIKNYSIAELSYIDGFEFSNFNDITAMLLKLERLKVIKIENEKIIVLDYSGLNLKESEIYLINNIKDGCLDELNKKTLKNIIENECVADNLIEIIPKQVEKANLINNIGKSIQIAFLIPVFIAVCYISIPVFKNFNNITRYTPHFIIILIVIFSTIAFAKLIISSGKSQVTFKLLDNGKEIYDKLNGLKNYIKDFSNLDSKEKQNLQLWDDYLIYSVMFGLNKQIPDKYIKILQRNPDIRIASNSDKGIYFKH